MNKFDWEYIHSKCDLNFIRDNLWRYSRFFGLRFTNIVNMIEDEYYFESLLSLIVLLEQFISSITHKTNAKFEDLINIYYKDSRNSIAHNLRELRNHLAHRYLFKYYVSFDLSEEYPLSEISNYETILFRLFLPIISCFDDSCKENVSFSVGEYTIKDLANQYGYANEIDAIISFGIAKGMSKNEVEKIKRENELNFMRKIDNSSPVNMWVDVLKKLFK